MLTYFDPTSLGATEYNILEVQALADGRLVFGFPSSGLLVWEPGEPKRRRLTQRDGLRAKASGACPRTTCTTHRCCSFDGRGLVIFRNVP